LPERSSFGVNELLGRMACDEELDFPAFTACVQVKVLPLDEEITQDNVGKVRAFMKLLTARVSHG
jgi:hypothetical protein